MALIYESENFLVNAPANPLVDRKDGGHITIDPKIKISTRQELLPRQAIELMRLTMVTGEAMTAVMNDRGVDIGRLNYQDNGNWSVFLPGGPLLHYHLYGRAMGAVHQKYGHALFFPHKDIDPGYYQNLQPLTAGDIEAINVAIGKLLREEKYKDENWCL